MTEALTLDQYAGDLMRALQRRISVDDLAECAAGNLKATRKIRLSKDNPEGYDEPDCPTRQKALEWIGDKLLPNAGSRKPIEAAPTDGDSKPAPGLLKERKGRKAAGE